MSIYFENENSSDEHKRDLFFMFCKYSGKIINPRYIGSLLKNTEHKTVLFCIDNNNDDFAYDNCPTGLIYSYDKETNIYYILFICTHPRFKNMGYASLLLEEFILHVRKSSNNTNTKIVVSSIESSVTFYEHYGFRWTRETIDVYPKLVEVEETSNDKESFILVMEL